MDCTKCKKLFSAYLDGDLNPEVRQSIERHLADCGNCTAEFAEFRTVVAQASELPEIKPSPNFHSNLRAKLSETESARGFSFIFDRRTLTVAGLICLLLIAGFGTYYYFTEYRSGRSEDDQAQMLIAKESIPLVESRTGANVMKQFVMPNVPAVEVRVFSEEAMDDFTAADWPVNKSFALPFIMSEDRPENQPDTNYVLKRVSLISTSDEAGL